MHVRTLLAEDAAEYQAIRLRGLAEEPTAFASSYEEEVGTPIVEIARRLHPKETGAIFGAFTEGKLVGVTGVQREEMRKLSHKAFLWGMYVSPEHRSGGLGSQLLRRALSYAWQSLRVAQVNLGVHTENDRAIALYRSAGFVIWGTELGALVSGAERQNEHHMVCCAPSAA